MKIKSLWGFEGDAMKLGTTSSTVRAGQTFDQVDKEYAHQLIGKGLAEEVKIKEEAKPAEPKSAKQAAPKENK